MNVTKLSLADKLKEDNLPYRDISLRKLEVCSIVLTDEELESISSIRTGFTLARERLIEEHLKDVDPWFYNKIKGAGDRCIPIHDIKNLALEFASTTED